MTTNTRCGMASLTREPTFGSSGVAFHARGYPMLSVADMDGMAWLFLVKPGTIGSF